MQVIKDINELNKVLHQQVLQIIKKVAEEVRGVMRNELKRLWYNRPNFNEDNSQYLRTFQLLDCITVSPVVVNGNSYEVKVFYDSSKIVAMDGTDGKPWTRHKSIVDDRDSNFDLPYWVEEGQNSSIYSFKGSHSVESVRKWLQDDQYLLNRFQELLKDRGFGVIKN